jgi:hypothetical protein
MTNAETKTYLLEWVKSNHGIFAWPTDGCGYNQHMKFVRHRNKNWKGGDFKQFVIDYANSLDSQPEINQGAVCSDSRRMI